MAHQLFLIVIETQGRPPPHSLQHSFYEPHLFRKYSKYQNYSKEVKAFQTWLTTNWILLSWLKIKAMDSKLSNANLNPNTLWSTVVACIQQLVFVILVSHVMNVDSVKSYLMDLKRISLIFLFPIPSCLADKGRQIEKRKE